MPVEKKMIPVAPMKGLYLDDISVPGGLSKAENIIILADGSAKRRGYVRTFAESPTCLASRGFKGMFEYKKSNGERILFADMDYAGPLMKVTAGDATGTTDIEISWASVLSGLTTGTTVHPTWATLQDRAFRVDGINSNYIFTSKTSYQNNGVTKPTAAPALGETTGGSLTLLGEYNVYYTYVKKDGRLGTEKITGATAASTWTPTTNWTYGTGWEHSTGDATALVANWEPIAGVTYKLIVTHTTSVNGTGYGITCGGVTIASGITTGATTDYIFKATNTNALTFTPGAGGTWVGELTIISILLADYIVESNPCPVANKTLTGSNNAITVTTVASSGENVSFIRLYRTFYGQPLGSAYYDQEVLNASALYTMTQSDDTIRDLNSVMISPGAPIPKVKYVVACGSRMFYLNAPAEVGGSGTMWWSTLDKPESVPALNYQTFDANDGDELMGGIGLHNNILVFKRKKTWICDIYSTDTTVNYDGTVTASLGKHIVSSTLGCIASGSIQSIGDINGAIWLSAEGIQLYAGGELKNISKDRINSAIFAAIANADCTDYIESCYHPNTRLYHINLLYKNVAGTEIVGQRHFVYNLSTDSWTEYVYYADDGIRYYETNFAIVNDSNNNDVFLSAYLTEVSATTVFIYQCEYTEVPSDLLNNAAFYSHSGSGIKNKMYCDTSDSLYIFNIGIDGLGGDSTLFKIDNGGNLQGTISALDFITPLGLDGIINPDDCSIGIDSLIPGKNNDEFYVAGEIFAAYIPYYNFVAKIAYNLVITSIYLSDVQAGSAWLHSDIYTLTSPIAISEDGTILYMISGNKLQTVTNPGDVSQVITDIYTFTTSYVPTCGPLSIYNDAMYYGNIYRLLTLSDTPTLEIISTGMDPSYLIVVSDIELYFIDGITHDLIQGVYSNGSWIFNTVMVFATIGTVNDIKRLSSGEFLVADYGVSGTLRLISADFSTITTIYTVTNNITSFTTYIGNSEKEHQYLIADNLNTDV